MDVINFSKDKIETLDRLPLDDNVFNTEAEIFTLIHKGNLKVFKRLFHQSGHIFANKLYTLEMLDTYKEVMPSNFVIPDYLVTSSGNIIGFTCPKIEGKTMVTLLNSRYMPHKEKIYYLKKVGELLEQMKQIRESGELADFYLNDLHSSNFMINPQNKELKVVDTDSIKICRNKPFPARYLTPRSLINYNDKYVKNNNQMFGYIIADENSDLYCYIITILEYLTGEKVGSFSEKDYHKLLNYLSTCKLNKELLGIFEMILLDGQNQNPEMYLDSIDEKTFEKCRHFKI